MAIDAKGASIFKILLIQGQYLLSRLNSIFVAQAGTEPYALSRAATSRLLVLRHLSHPILFVSIRTHPA